MRDATHDEQVLLAAALGEAFPARWKTWELSVRDDDARVDDDGNVHVHCTLAWFSADGVLLGAVEAWRTLLHIADLVDEPTRARSYFAALVSSLPALAEWLGFQPGDAVSNLLPPTPLLEDLSLQTVEQFEERLVRAAWLDSGPYPLPSLLDHAAPEPVAIDEDQEAELATWPQALWPYARYARWLMDRGDPRGALVAAHVGTRDRDPGVRRVHERKARHLIAQHARYFLGPFAAGNGEEPFGDEVLFTWDLGFIRHIELDLRLDASGPPPLAVLNAALTLPSSRLAARLLLSVAPSAFELEERHPLLRWTELLVASGGHDRIRSIEIAPPPDLDEDPFFAPADGPPILVEDEDVNAIRTVFPRADVVMLGRTPQG